MIICDADSSFVAALGLVERNASTLATTSLEHLDAVLLANGVDLVSASDFAKRIAGAVRSAGQEFVDMVAKPRPSHLLVLDDALVAGEVADLIIRHRDLDVRTALLLGTARVYGGSIMVGRTASDCLVRGAKAEEIHLFPLRLPDSTMDRSAHKLRNTQDRRTPTVVASVLV